MKNEKILIFGDSYSTFAGYIPEGYAAYYPSVWVTAVEQTWWQALAAETDSEIVLNNSWSGSTVCNTGYNGDCSKINSFIFRLEQLIEQGFFRENPPDRVFVFGGTNDSWSGNAAGEVMLDGWTAEDLFLVLPGISYFLHKLAQTVGREKVHVIVNTELRDEVAQGILTVCDRLELGRTVLHDIDKLDGHPTAVGMHQIMEQVLENC